MEKRFFIALVSLATLATGAESQPLAANGNSSITNGAPSVPATNGESLVSEVKPFGGAPALWIDGRPHTGLMHFNRWPKGEDVEVFKAAGVHLYSIMGAPEMPAPDGGKADYGDGKAALAILTRAWIDETFSLLERHDPEAKVLLRMRLTTPDWWRKAHPGECVVTSDNAGNLSRRPWASPASKAWREECAKAMRRTIDYVEGRWGDKVLGYHPGLADCCENSYAWGRNLADLSPASQKAFGSKLPEPKSFFAQSVWDHQRLFDPVRDANAIAFMHRQSEVMAEGTVFLAKVVKDELRRLGRTKICGAFYGYMCLPVNLTDLLGSGHLAQDKVLSSPDIDFIAAPIDYSSRQLGGTSLAQALPGSIAAHGKLYWAEEDTRLNLAKEEDTCVAKDFQESANLLRRSFLDAFSHGGTVWWMDLFGRGWYRDKGFVPILNECREFAERHFHARESVAQFAVFVTDRAVASERAAPLLLSNELVATELPEVAAVGAPYDIYRLEDLSALAEKGRLSQYRLALVLNAHTLSERLLKETKTHLCRDRRTVVFLGPAGYVIGGNSGAKNCARLTGIEMKERTMNHSGIVETFQDGRRHSFGSALGSGPSLRVIDETAQPIGWYLHGSDSARPDEPKAVAIAQKQMQGWRSVVSVANFLPSDVIRRLAEESGVAVISPCGDQVFAGKGWVGVAAKMPGKRKLHLPWGDVEVSLGRGECRIFEDSRYAVLRRELRAFYPDECHDVCKLAAQTNSVHLIARDIDAFVAANPEADALDIRRASYLSMRKHFVPVVFDNLDFYFEAGVNGGWSVWCGDRAVPSRHVNAVCQRFYRQKNLIPQEEFRLLYDRIGAGRLIVCCGPFVDNEHHIPPFHTIFTRGFKGVRDDVARALAKCPATDARGRKELETALVGLDTIHEIQLKFHEAAKKKGDARMIESSARCPWEPPKSFYEGLNTLWFVREILGYVDALCCFSLGRPDAWLIDFYRADIAAGRLTKAEARDLIDQFLIVSDCHLDDKLFLDKYSDQEAEMPLTLGGVNTRGEFVWNELTEMFLEEHLRQDLVFPKLHCRISENAPAPYLRKIGDLLLHDHAVFALFNDDIHIPNFVKLGLPLDRARDYVGTGCWDGNVDSEMDIDTANYLSVARILEMTIHRNAEEERRYRVKIDPIDDAQSYEAVEETLYRNFIRFAREVLSGYTRYGRANSEIFPHPTYSMCLHGCIESRRDTTDAGTAFHPRVVTLAFMANVVDSLCAIREVCFEKKEATLGEFLAAVRSNWAGEKGERLRLKAMAAPYWGDNSDASTSIMRRWIDRVSDDLKDLKNDQGGPYLLACWIYREFIFWGEKMKATPDGRHNGDRLAQGFAPSEFRCKEGASSVIGALAKLDHTRLYASNANLMFDRASVSPEVFEAIFRVTAQSKMHLLQPNCAAVEDLIDAQIHPERHQNIIVKVCGYSARFVSLPKRWQDEVIARHRLK